MMQVCYRPSIMEDKSQLLELFECVPAVIAGMSNRLVYKAIIDDAQRSNNDVAIFVAVLDSRLVGYVITTWDWNHFKRTFVQRHPLIGVTALTKRLKRKLNAQDASANRGRLEAVDAPATADTEQHYSWEDGAITIAKVIHIGIDVKVRSRGIGSALYTNLIKHLGQSGFTRIDAHIDKDNLHSVNMHKKAGWTVIQNASGFFAFFEIKRVRVE